MSEFSFELFLTIAPYIFFAGIVDAIAGGGGIISVPAYLASGLNPGLVLGTNKLSSSIGTIVSAANYYRRIPVALDDFTPLIIASLIGSTLGAHTVLLINPAFIKILLVVVIPIVAWLVYRSKGFGRQDRSHEVGKAARTRRGLLLCFTIGYYDGFFGPGTGTFLALGFSRYLKYDLLQSTARAKYLNLASNLAALVTFLSMGGVQIALGASLGILSIAGHYLGSRAALKNGARLIRPVIIVVLVILLAKICLDIHPEELKRLQLFVLP